MFYLCFLYWPTRETLAKVKLRFENVHGIPQCCSALDCFHVTFDLLGRSRSIDCYDRNHNYSTIIQAIVDHEAHFIDVFAGRPRSIHNFCIFLMSNHFRDLIARRGQLNGPTMEVEGVDVSELIIADASYIGEKNMLVPSPGICLPRVYDELNFKHSST